MDTPILCMDCGAPPRELYKVHDDLWNSVCAPTDVLCIKCFEKRLGRELTILDIDLFFPWWEADRRDYYRGILHGIFNQATRPLDTPSEYRVGFELAQSLVKGDMPDDFFRAMSILKEELLGQQAFGQSALAVYVRERLPADYFITADDLKWLDECNSFLNAKPTNASVTAAVDDAVICHPGGHIDPFELLIDAGVCDTNCEPCAEPP